MKKFVTGIFRKFDGFTAAEMTTLEAACTAKVYEKGRWLITEGHRAAGCFVILDGTVDVITEVTGEPEVIATLRAGHIVGQTALVSSSTRRVGVLATARVEVLALNRSVFARLLAEHTPMAIRFQRQIAVDNIRQLRGAIEKLAALSERIHAAEESGSAGRTLAQRARAKRSAVGKVVLTEPSVSVALLDSIEVSVPEGERYRRFDKQR